MEKAVSNIEKWGKEMNKVEELLNKMCPNGVKYIPLEDVIEKNPKSKTGAKLAEKMPEGQIPFFTSGKNTYYVCDYLVDGENIFINDGGNADFKYYDGKANYADHVISIKAKNINGRFFIPYFITNERLY